MAHKKEALMTKRQREAFVTKLRDVIADIPLTAAHAEKWIRDVRKAAPVIFGNNPQDVLRAIKWYVENPPVKPLLSTAVACPPVNKIFTLAVGKTKKRCKLVRIGFHRNFEAVQARIVELYGGIPPANFLHAFKNRYPMARGLIAVAVATEVSGKLGLRQFPIIREDCSESSREFYSNVAFGDEMMWLVVA